MMTVNHENFVQRTPSGLLIPFYDLVANSQKL